MYGHSVYTASKYALKGLAEGLRFELLPYNIKVSLICPGFTNTAFLVDDQNARVALDDHNGKYLLLSSKMYIYIYIDMIGLTVKSVFGMVINVCS